MPRIAADVVVYDPRTESEYDVGNNKKGCPLPRTTGSEMADPSAPEEPQQSRRPSQPLPVCSFDKHLRSGDDRPFPRGREGAEATPPVPSTVNADAVARAPVCTCPFARKHQHDTWEPALLLVRESGHAAGVIASGVE